MSIRRPVLAGLLMEYLDCVQACYTDSLQNEAEQEET